MSDLSERACRINRERTTQQLMREVRFGFISQDEYERRENDRRARLESMAERDLSGLTHLIPPLAHHANMFGRFAREAGGLTGGAVDDARSVLRRLEQVVADLRHNIEETAPKAEPVRLMEAAE